jgi:hypothetical protein
LCAAVNIELGQEDKGTVLGIDTHVVVGAEIGNGEGNEETHEQSIAYVWGISCLFGFLCAGVEVWFVDSRWLLSAF